MMCVYMVGEVYTAAELYRKESWPVKVAT